MATETYFDSFDHACPQPPHLKYVLNKIRPRSLEISENLTKLEIDLAPQ